ncbi:hypothetical protein PBAL39_20915 [Pedobacter sp. BAL39]|uniref:hypothetical protein n=1 Tax=Pedobacter sp. BAL39 TaxID=391596 RepID=UPI00015596A2|nr:hypothetical protein [Pedobacter sp. BAL39]EDM38574.1 hypothetical protein PBAL39_20915 [Pedobacter sp. BAL39]
MERPGKMTLWAMLLFSLLSSACQKDDLSKVQPPPLDVLNNSKTWTLVNPEHTKCKSFGVSNGTRYPYDRMQLSSASFTVSKENGQFIITEIKEGTESGIADFSPLLFTSLQTRYHNSYHIQYNPLNKSLTYEQMPGQVYPTISLFYLLGGYRIVSISKDTLVVKDPFPLDNGLNGKWIGELTFISH